MNKEIKEGIFTNYFYFYQELFQNSKWNFPLFLGNIVGNVAISYLILYIPKWLLWLVEEQVSITKVIGCMVFVGILLILIRLLSSETELLLKNQCLKFRHVLEEKILKKICHTSYSNLEDPEYRKMVDHAKELYERWDRDVCCCLYISSDAIIFLLKIIISASILSMLHPFAVISMILAVLVQYQAGKYLAKWKQSHRGLWQPLEMKMEYISRKISEFSSAKDLRLYTAHHWLLPKYQRLMKERQTWNKKQLKQENYTNIINRFAELFPHIIVYFFLIQGVLKEQIRADEFVLYVGLAISFSDSLFVFIDMVKELRETSISIFDYRLMLYKKDSITRPEESHNLLPKSIPELVFSHVSFSYPNAKNKTLDDLNFVVKPREKIAIVGLNGAGKTTLIKVLCGMYEATKGEILIDGLKASKQSLEDYYSLFSVVFQDLNIIPATIAENVATCSSQELDREKVISCLKQAGLWELIEKLPDKIDTYLPKEMFKKGTLLSGGETQKLLLARAIYKEAPILILDEPTAALDAIAENELYLQYNELTKNRTSFYISHRLSSTRFCDRIFMMEKGKIIEVGSHKELMEKKGAYYQLYQVQSHYYQNDRLEAFESEIDSSWEVQSYVSS